MPVVSIVLIAVGAYLVVGLLAAVFLQVRGLATIDPATRGAGLGFRLLVTPGLMALWPVLLVKYGRAKAGRPAAGTAEAPVSPARLRTVHGLLTALFAVTIPMVTGGALMYRTPLLFQQAELYKREPDGGIEEVLAANERYFEDAHVGMEIVRGVNGEYYIILRPYGPVPPGLHLYWKAPGSQPGGTEMGYFVGTLWNADQYCYTLPMNPFTTRGALLAYSTLDQELFEAQEFPSIELPGSGGVDAEAGSTDSKDGADAPEADEDAE